MTERNTTAMERTYQRRRLGVLGGILALVLGASPVLASAPGGDGDLDVAAADVPVHAAAGSPTAMRGLDDVPASAVEGSRDTTTTVPTASTTMVPPTTPAPPTTQAPASTTTTPAEVEDEVASEVTEGRADPVASTSKRASTPTPTSTAPPTTAPPPTTTTTAAPPPAASSTSSAEGGYAYDDPRSTQVWYDLAACESGGNWSIDSGNGYYGGLQFSLATWESVGGTGYPHEHPAATQIEMGRRLQARQGWGAWPHCSEELGLR